MDTYDHIRACEPLHPIKGIAASADSVYNISPGSAKQETLRQESSEMLLKDTEESLRRKQKEDKNAKNLLDALKKN
jgi:hypothetical protein